jgi:hypothetical protein
MKLSKQELKQRISDSIKDNDELVISLLEDVEDSMSEGSNDDVQMETLKKEKEELEWKYNDIKTRYKERFLAGVDEIKENPEEKIDEVEEKEVVDIKDI